MDRLECDRMFVAVVEARSFTGAAVKLGTSSGQASKLVSRLEAELGVRLLNRTTRAVSETEAGRAYFERVRSILDEIDNLDLAIRNVAQTPRGRLRLTAPLTTATSSAAPALARFLWLVWKSALPSAIAGFAVKMPQTTSLSSVAAEVPKSAGTRVKASRSS